MTKETNFYNSIIKQLILHYQQLDVITDPNTLCHFTDTEYQIETGRKNLNGLVTNFISETDCHDETAKQENARIYDAMRKNVSRCLDVWQQSHIPLMPELDFTKPQFYLEQYPQEDALKFLQAFLEITTGLDQSNLQVNRRIKHNLNAKIDIENDFSVISKIFAAMDSSFTEIPFQKFMKEYDQILSWYIREIREKYINDIQAEIQDHNIINRPDQYLQVIKSIFTVTNAHIHQIQPNMFLNHPVQQDICSCEMILAKIQTIRLRWQLMVKHICQIIDYLMLRRDIHKENIQEICEKIEAIPIKQYQRKYQSRSLINDFLTYHNILYIQNEFLEELRVQIYKLQFIEQQPPIADEYRFLEDDNSIKKKFDDVNVLALSGKELQEYNTYFNLGQEVSHKTFQKYIHFLKEQVPTFNTKTGRDLHPEEDISVCRALYRTFFSCPSFVYKQNTKDNNDNTQKQISKKKFYNLWKEYEEKNTMSSLEYLAYSNTLSCLIILESKNGAEHFECKTNLMISMYKVLNLALIQLLTEASEETCLKHCMDEIDQLFVKLVSVIYPDLNWQELQPYDPYKQT